MEFRIYLTDNAKLSFRVKLRDLFLLHLLIISIINYSLFVIHFKTKKNRKITKITLAK